MEIYKLRIKHPSGAEFEAQGTESFIINEKRDFLAKIAGRKKDNAERSELFILEKELTTPDKNNIYYLKAHYPHINVTEAALIILAANIEEKKKGLSAISLAKALKKSGYKPKRLDRLLSIELKNADIIASGTKRNRAYSLSQNGSARANLAAKKALNLMGEKRVLKSQKDL